MNSNNYYNNNDDDIDNNKLDGYRVCRNYPIIDRM